MRKLYRKSTVHPTLTSSSSSISDHLAFLPATILALTAALSPEDKEVLAYLLSCSTSNNNNNLSCNYRREKQHHYKGCVFGADEHCAVFSCSCFRCYMSYWIRWDSSPNRQLIHKIIDAFEDHLVKKRSSKKSRRKKEKSLCVSELTRSEIDSVKEVQTGAGVVVVDDDDKDVSFSDDGLEFDKGSMRKFVSFIGERIWGVFGGKENDGK